MRIFCTAVLRKSGKTLQAKGIFLRIQDASGKRANVERVVGEDEAEETIQNLIRYSEIPRVANWH